MNPERAGSGGFPGPHRFPFRFIDRAGSDLDRRPMVKVSTGCALPGSFGSPRGSTAAADYPLTLLVEIMAQGALVLLSPAGLDPSLDGASVRLAGVDGARLHRPIRPGDRLRVDARVAGRFGALSKVVCRVERDGETVAEASLLLAGA